MTEPDITPSIATTASSHADLLLRITELTRALVNKGVISQEDIKTSMTDGERDALRIVLLEKFLESAERIAREEGLSD